MEEKMRDQLKMLLNTMLKVTDLTKKCARSISTLNTLQACLLASYEKRGQLQFFFHLSQKPFVLHRFRVNQVLFLYRNEILKFFQNKKKLKVFRFDFVLILVYIKSSQYFLKSIISWWRICNNLVHTNWIQLMGGLKTSLEM